MCLKKTHCVERGEKERERVGEGKRDRGRKGKRLGAEINFQVSELTGKGGK